MVVGCPDADTWGGLVAGGLPEDRRAEIADHAAACEQCHAVVAALVNTGALAEGSMASDATSPESVPNTGGSFEVGRGTQIDRYVIEERLGAGGMGVVYAARDSKLQRRVAVKLLRPDRNDQMSSNARKRLLREARTLARLSHPNVVTVFDVGEHGDQMFVAMELVEGGSLSAWLRRAQRTPDEITDRLLEAARGLAAAHQAGVIHRDIKPDNILVGPDGRARVTDFGLATPVDAGSLRSQATRPSITDMRSLTRTGALLGTPVYMAPEQIAGGDADARSDQWSFCMTLYEALAGVRPFVADLVARVPAIREGRLAPPAADRHVPRWVRRIVVRGLRADPGERWPSIDAIVEALARGRNRRWPSSSSSLQPARRRWRVRIAIAGLAVSIAGVATFAAMRDGSSTGDAPPVPPKGSAGDPATTPVPNLAATRPEDKSADVKAHIHAALAAFKAWSSVHAGAPCPSASDLASSGDARVLDDPWGHAVAITCTDQPADQIGGVVSAGPDGAFGTDDDIASWTLGREVTDLVRGSRWKVDVVPPSTPPAAAPPKRSPKPIRRPTTGKPLTPPPSTPTQPPAVDEDGIPTRRWGN